MKYEDAFSAMEEISEGRFFSMYEYKTEFGTRGKSVSLFVNEHDIVSNSGKAFPSWEEAINDIQGKINIFKNEVSEKEKAELRRLQEKYGEAV